MHFSTLCACVATVALFPCLASAVIIDDSNADSPIHKTSSFQGAGKAVAGEQLGRRHDDAATQAPIERRGDPTVRYKLAPTPSFVVVKRAPTPAQKRDVPPEDVLSTRPHLSVPSPVPDNCTGRGRWRINQPWRAVPVDRREAFVPAPEVVDEGQDGERKPFGENRPSNYRWGGRCSWAGPVQTLPIADAGAVAAKRDSEETAPPAAEADEEWVPRLPVVDLPKPADADEEWVPHLPVVDLPKPVNHSELDQPMYLQDKQPSADGPRTPLKFHNHRGGN